jgi:hypothetical protein
VLINLTSLLSGQIPALNFQAGNVGTAQVEHSQKVLPQYQETSRLGLSFESNTQTRAKVMRCTVFDP